MTPAPAAAGYAAPVKVLHWATTALLVAAYPLAWSVENASSVEQAHGLVMLHRSLGLAVLAVTLVRLGWRLRGDAPPLPPETPGWQRLAARANHAGLYALLLAQPTLGLTASWLHGDRIVLPGGLALPSPLPVDRALSRQVFALHGWIALMLLGLIGLHVAAALIHHFVLRDTVLTAMLGVRGPRPAVSSHAGRMPPKEESRP